MKLYKKTFKKPKDNKVILVPFGDQHYGSKNCDVKKMQEVVDWVLKTPNAYILGMGDWLETATKTSIGAGVFEQDQHLQEQLDNFLGMLKPLAKKGKILGVLKGNHEARVYNTSGLDLSKIIADNLKVPYFGKSIFMKLKVGDYNYTVYATHGSSGAKLPYTKIKNVLDLARFIDVDLYLMGHMHELQHHAQSYYKIDIKNKQIKEYDKHFVITGSYLEYWDSYADEKNMVPGKKGSPKVKLRADKKEIRVSL